MPWCASQWLWMTGERECATGHPKRPAIPKVLCSAIAWFSVALMIICRRAAARRCVSCGVSGDFEPTAARRVTAEEQAVEVRIVEQLTRRPIERKAPHFEHQRAVCILERRAHVLLDHQHRHATVGELPQERHHLLHELG